MINKLHAIPNELFIPPKAAIVFRRNTDANCNASDLNRSLIYLLGNYLCNYKIDSTQANKGMRWNTFARNAIINVMRQHNAPCIYWWPTRDENVVRKMHLKFESICVVNVTMCIGLHRQMENKWKRIAPIKNEKSISSWWCRMRSMRMTASLQHQ